MKGIPISILCFNRPEYLYRMLRSLRNTNRGYELLLVDNASSDRRTLKLLASLNFPARVSMFPQSVPIGSAKNWAIDYMLENYPEAQYQYSFDSDMLFKRDCLTEAVEEMNKLIEAGYNMGILGLFRHPDHKFLRDINGKIIENQDSPGNGWLLRVEMLPKGLRFNPVSSGSDSSFVKKVKKAGYEVFTFRESVMKHIGKIKATSKRYAFDFKSDGSCKARYNEEWFDESKYEPLEFADMEGLEWVKLL